MVKHYVYRMARDTGFAPNISLRICSLTGCKVKKKDGRRNIEELAEPGSWVIGIGGNNTKQPDKIIYAMEVESNLTLDQFLETYPGKSKYLIGREPGSNVLVSRKFYYFGDEAINVPEGLKHIIIDRQGYWSTKVTDEAIKMLKKYFSKKGYKYGVHGKPNNPEKIKKC